MGELGKVEVPGLPVFTSLCGAPGCRSTEPGFPVLNFPNATSLGSCLLLDKGEPVIDPLALRRLGDLDVRLALIPVLKDGGSSDAKPVVCMEFQEKPLFVRLRGPGLLIEAHADYICL